MNSNRIYPGRDGWIYEAWIDPRIVVSGWCASREQATVASAIGVRRVSIGLVAGDLVPRSRESTTPA